MKFCINCGQQLEDGTLFCPACGTKVIDVKDEPKEAPEPISPAMARPVAYQPKKVKKPVTVEEPQQQLGFWGSVVYASNNIGFWKNKVAESRKSVFWWAFLWFSLWIILVDVILSLMSVTYLVPLDLIDVALTSACMRRLRYLGYNWKLGWLLLVPIVNIYPYILMLLNTPRKKAK